MGRSPKKGLDYFKKDTDFYTDEKIVDLMDRYGPLGVTVYDIILCLVYKNGYYLETPADRLAKTIARIIGGRWIRKKDLVLQVIRGCAELGLIDKTLLKQDVITSVGLQKRYAEVTVRNKVNKDKYWLLEKNPAQEVLESEPQTKISVTEKPVSVTEKPVSVTETPQDKEKSKISYVTECVRNTEYSTKGSNIIKGFCGGSSPPPTQEKSDEKFLLLGEFKNVKITRENYLEFIKLCPGCAETVIDQLSRKIKLYPKKYGEDHYVWLKIFAENYMKKEEKELKKRKTETERDPPSFNIEKAEEESLRLNPAETKRKKR